MPEQSIRFGVSDGTRFRAASWKCWSPSGKDDVYLSCRELKGALKASLHESGNWHFAYDGSFFEKSVPREDRKESGRFIDSWPEPKAIAPGVLLAFRVVTPWTSVCSPLVGQPDFTVVPIPKEGKAIELDLFIVEPTTPVSGWPGKDSMSTSLVGSYGLPTGRTVWVVYWEIEMPKLPDIKGQPKYFTGKSIDDLKDSTNLKLLAFGDEPDGSKVIYDCKVTYEKRGT